MTESSGYAEKLNKLIRRTGVSETIANNILKTGFQNLINCFDDLDPYIQAMSIQCVINLKTDEFNKIKDKYREIIELGSKSENEWVQRSAYMFKDYPNIRQCDDFHDFDLSVLESDKNENDANEKKHFNLDLVVKPPSSSLPPPKLPEKRAPDAVGRAGRLPMNEQSNMGVRINGNNKQPPPPQERKKLILSSGKIEESKPRKMMEASEFDSISAQNKKGKKKKYNPND